MPAIVCITTKSANGTGSGVIINKEGLILTAGHVTQATGNHYQGSVTFKGLDAQGKYITEAVALTGNPGIVTTTATTKYFAQVLEIDVPAQKDLLGSFQFGIYGDDIGLSRPPKARTTALFITWEARDGAKVTTGALINRVTAPPYGAFTPAVAPTPTISSV